MSDYQVDPQLFIAAGVFPDRETLLQAGARSLWETRPEMRLAIAVYRYQHEPISVEKAAHIAGISFDQMKDALAGRGVTLRLGNGSVKDVLEDLRSLESAAGE